MIEICIKGGGPKDRRSGAGRWREAWGACTQFGACAGPRHHRKRATSRARYRRNSQALHCSPARPARRSASGARQPPGERGPGCRPSLAAYLLKDDLGRVEGGQEGDVSVADADGVLDKEVREPVGKPPARAAKAGLTVGCVCSASFPSRFLGRGRQTECGITGDKQPDVTRVPQWRSRLAGWLAPDVACGAARCACAAVARCQTGHGSPCCCLPLPGCACSTRRPLEPHRQLISASSTRPSLHSTMRLASCSQSG